MKIRWYHWLLYRLFRWAWNPILRERPGMVKMLSGYMSAYSEAPVLYWDSEQRKNRS
jgi:hypothetical protein